MNEAEFDAREQTLDKAERNTMRWGMAGGLIAIGGPLAGAFSKAVGTYNETQSATMTVAAVISLSVGSGIMGYSMSNMKTLFYRRRLLEARYEIDSRNNFNRPI